MTKDIDLTKKEIEVLISLIHDYQWDGASYTLEGIKLNELEKKLKESLEKAV
jgi:hypothetical protein